MQYAELECAAESSSKRWRRGERPREGEESDSVKVANQIGQDRTVKRGRIGN
jgi:hypothetical protein